LPCEWKTVRPPEGAQGSANAGGNTVQGVIDVCSTLNPDAFSYAAFPAGIPANAPAPTARFAQTAKTSRES